MTSVEEFTKFFKAADKDGSGSLSYEELSEVLKKHGYRDHQIKVCKTYIILYASKLNKKAGAYTCSERELCWYW